MIRITKVRSAFGRTLSLILLSTVPLAIHAQADEHDDQWKPLQTLVGKWEGDGAGFGATSAVSHSWEFAINGTFLRLTTRSISTAPDGSREVHEDVGYVSFDSDNERFVFRQFLSEGFVNTYDLEITHEDPLTVEFIFRDVESGGGQRARMHMVFTDRNAYEMVLDLADSGGEFVACQTMQMRRTSDRS